MNPEPREDIHITIFDLIEVGKDFCKGINAAYQNKLIAKYWLKPPEKKHFKDKRYSLTKLNSEKINDKIVIQATTKEELRGKQRNLLNKRSEIPTDPRYKSGISTKRGGNESDGSKSNLKRSGSKTAQSRERIKVNGVELLVRRSKARLE
jgi:hypothetical protein